MELLYYDWNPMFACHQLTDVSDDKETIPIRTD